MSKTAGDWIVIGRFGRVHGVKGLITIHSFTDPRNAIADYLPWYIRQGSQRKPLKIRDLRIQDKHILVQIEGVDDRDQAALFTNLDIEIQQSTLPPLSKGEYYWFELIGMQVVNRAEESLGIVVEMMSTGAHDVLVVEGEERHLIPYLPDIFIDHIDKEKRLIVVDWGKDF